MIAIAPVFTRRKTHRVPGEFLSPRYIRLRSQERRRINREAKRCINASPSGKPSRFGVVHGEPNEKSGKCDRCEAIAARSR